MDIQQQMQYIIDNYDELSYQQFAEKLGLAGITIAKRVERLKKRGLLPDRRKIRIRDADYSKLTPYQNK